MHGPSVADRGACGAGQACGGDKHAQAARGAAAGRAGGAGGRARRRGGCGGQERRGSAGVPCGHLAARMHAPPVAVRARRRWRRLLADRRAPECRNLPERCELPAARSAWSACMHGRRCVHAREAARWRSSCMPAGASGVRGSAHPCGHARAPVDTRARACRPCGRRCGSRSCGCGRLQRSASACRCGLSLVSLVAF